MARSLWKGSINFGLVHIPVKMYKAASGKDLRFRELHDADHSPLKQKRFCPVDGEEVPREHIVKGYEIAPEQFVIVKPEELEALEKGEAHTINIEAFVDLGDVDPVYFENSYYVTPDKGAARAYALLLAAMHDANKAAIARVVLRQKQHLVLLRASNEAIAMSTLYYYDEVLEQDKLDELPRDIHPDKRELEMAKQLIESLSENFKPEKYHDEYRERVLDLIEKKAEGKRVTLPRAKPESARVIDLVSALQASLNAGGKKPAAASKATNGKAKHTKTAATKTKKRISA